MKKVIMRPPVWDALQKAGFATGGGCIFTYGDTIYNPDNAVIDEPLEIHEAVHCRQQLQIGSPMLWWDKWMSDPVFRATQEAQAYAAQYNEMKKHWKNREDRNRYLLQISKHLSSGMYRLNMTQADARAAILARA